jgi:uncharacterized protein YjbI with pentapeptide repeats
MATPTDNRAPMILVEFDKGLFQQFSVSAWNAFLDDLFNRHMIPPAWAQGEKPSPISVVISLRRLVKRNYHLDGINFMFVDISDSDFSGASLRGVTMLSCPRTSFSNARLDGAALGEISGCDFSGASGLASVNFEDAFYDPAYPPIGLPAEMLAKCEQVKKEPPEPNEPPGGAVVKCSATIHFVPLEG